MSFPALDTYQSAANAALGAHSAPSAVASTTAIRPDPLTIDLPRAWDKAYARSRRASVSSRYQPQIAARTSVRIPRLGTADL